MSLRILLSYVSPVTRGGVVVLTPEQRAAVRALFIPSVVVLGSAVFLIVSALKGWVDTDVTVFRSYGTSVLFNSGCLGIILCYATLPARRAELAFVVPLAIGGELARASGHPGTFGDRLACFGFVAALVCMAGMAWRVFASRDDERLWARAMLLLSLIIIFNPAVSYMLHLIVIHHAPLVFDQFAYKVDGTFGFQPSEWAYRLVDGDPKWNLFFQALSWVLGWLTFIVYNQLPLFMMAAVLLGLRWPKSCYGHLMLHFMAIGMVGFLCYWLMPAIGSNLFIGPGFARMEQPYVHVPRVFHDTAGNFRNCYPSLHMGWILAIYLGVRSVHPWVARFCLGLVVLMIPATLCIGHYAVDLVGSFPYVVAFFGLINATRVQNTKARLAAVLGGGALFVGFSLLLFRAPLILAANGAVLLAFVGLTIGGSLYLDRWLSRTTVQPVAAEIDGLESEGGRPWEPRVQDEAVVA